MGLDCKYDFIVYFSVIGANPNGDPVRENKPRRDYKGYGEISDVCIRRKIRNRFIDLGQDVFMYSDDRDSDGYLNFKERFNGELDISHIDDISEISKLASEKWIDVRSFGQVFDFIKGKKSVGVRGPVTMSMATSKGKVNLYLADNKKQDYRVQFGVYKFCGSIRPELAEKTGFNLDDIEIFKKALKTIFENDVASVRPIGSMKVEKIYWFKHSNRIGNCSSAKIHNSIKLEIEKPELNSFNRYKIIENIPNEFYRKQNDDFVTFKGI